LGLIGCNNITVKRDGTDGFKLEKSGLNTTIVYSRSDVLNKDSLLVLRHFWGNTYFFEDYNRDGSVDMIYISKLKKFIYKVDPVTGKKIEGYQGLFDKVDYLLNKYKTELDVDVSNEEGLLLKYLD